MIMPRSPWLASLGCTNEAGVPVEDSVPATFMPIWPLLPMPYVSGPRQPRMMATASAKLSVGLERERGFKRAQAFRFEPHGARS